MNEMMQHSWLTLYLRVALTLCMLSHDDIIQRALENAGHRKRQVNIYMYKIGALFCFPQFTYQCMLISYKVQCRTRWNIQNHVPNVTSRSSNEKWAIAWENLSFGITFTEEASGSIIRMRGSRGPEPPGIHRFYINICPPPPPWKIWTPSPVKCWTPSGTLKKYSFP